MPKNDLLIGSYEDCAGLNFPGKIDEVELFNRALAAIEIQSIFNAGSAGKCKTMTVNIVVVPSHYSNCISRTDGVVPVVILGSAKLDVTKINVNSLSLNGAPVSIKGNHLLCNITDFNNDSIPDLMCKFNASAISGSTSVTLTGKLIDNTPITGMQQLCITN